MAVKDGSKLGAPSRSLYMYRSWSKGKKRRSSVTPQGLSGWWKSLFYAGVNPKILKSFFEVFFFSERKSLTLTFTLLLINSMQESFCFPLNPLWSSESLLIADDISGSALVACFPQPRLLQPWQTKNVRWVSLWNSVNVLDIFICLFFESIFHRFISNKQGS